MLRTKALNHPRGQTLSNLYPTAHHPLRVVCKAIQQKPGVPVGGFTPPSADQLGTSGTQPTSTSTPDSSSSDSSYGAASYVPQPPTSAYLTLLFVTALWGSYNPTIRFLYDSDHALSPATLTGIRTAIAAAALAAAILVDRLRGSSTDADGKQKHQQRPAVVARSTAPDAPILSRTFDTVLLAGIELGMYNFLGTSLQAVGLQMTSATRAGFLVQLTAVLVPVLSALAGVPISGRVWGAACLALAGTVLIAMDGAPHKSASTNTTDASGPTSQATASIPTDLTTTAAPAELLSAATSSTPAVMTTAETLQAPASLPTIQALIGDDVPLGLPTGDIAAVSSLRGVEGLADAPVSAQVAASAGDLAAGLTTPAVVSGAVDSAFTAASMVVADVASTPATSAVLDTSTAATSAASSAINVLADAAIASANTPVVAIGDLYLIAACFFYSLATVRLGFYAPMFNSVELTAVKKFTLGTASFIWLASTMDFAGVEESISQQGAFDWTLVAYSALGPGALATFLQTKGQVSVPPTLAQVVYSLTPVWSAIMAYVILGDDGMGAVAWAGSGAILVASAVATSGGSKPAPMTPLPTTVTVALDEPIASDGDEPSSRDAKQSSPVAVGVPSRE